VFLPPWGKSEQWLISVQHDESDIDHLIASFHSFAAVISENKSMTGRNRFFTAETLRRCRTESSIDRTFSQ
jgi:hypothetical protein